MQIRAPFLKDFEIARPQIFAGLMLLALLISAFAIAYLGLSVQGFAVDRIRALSSDSILESRVEQLVTLSAAPISRNQFWPVVPFVIFGAWLGGALWWVSRRLYNNAGGYIALALYCSSPLIVEFSSRVNAEILAAWGLFGIVYTAIGVAHTLYAPPHKWRPRIVLLGTAFGITAAAHLSAALVGLAFAAFFMLYLSPGRRIASLVILGEASIVAFTIVWAFYGFSSAVFSVETARPRFESVLHTLNDSVAITLLPLLLLLIVAVLVFVAWPRTRYFGNWAPLLVLLVLLHLNFEGQGTLAWALPFAFVFVGGIFSDLLETHWHRVAAVIVITAVCVQELLVVLGSGRTVH